MATGNECPSILDEIPKGQVYQPRLGNIFKSAWNLFSSVSDGHPNTPMKIMPPSQSRSDHRIEIMDVCKDSRDCQRNFICGISKAYSRENLPVRRQNSGFGPPKSPSEGCEINFCTSRPEDSVEIQPCTRDLNNNIILPESEMDKNTAAGINTILDENVSSSRRSNPCSKANIITKGQTQSCGKFNTVARNNDPNQYIRLSEIFQSQCNNNQGPKHVLSKAFLESVSEQIRQIRLANEQSKSPTFSKASSDVFVIRSNSNIDLFEDTPKTTTTPSQNTIFNSSCGNNNDVNINLTVSLAQVHGSTGATVEIGKPTTVRINVPNPNTKAESLTKIINDPPPKYPASWASNNTDNLENVIIAHANAPVEISQAGEACCMNDIFESMTNTSIDDWKQEPAMPMNPEGDTNNKTWSNYLSISLAYTGETIMKAYDVAENLVANYIIPPDPQEMTQAEMNEGEDKIAISVMRLLGISQQARHSIYKEALQEVQVLHDVSTGTIDFLHNIANWIVTGDSATPEAILSKTRILATMQSEVEADSDVWQQFEKEISLFTEAVANIVKSSIAGTQGPDDVEDEIPALETATLAAIDNGNVENSVSPPANKDQESTAVNFEAENKENNSQQPNPDSRNENHYYYDEQGNDYYYNAQENANELENNFYSNQQVNRYKATDEQQNGYQNNNGFYENEQVIILESHQHGHGYESYGSYATYDSDECSEHDIYYTSNANDNIYSGTTSDNGFAGYEEPEEDNFYACNENDNAYLENVYTSNENGNIYIRNGNDDNIYTSNEISNVSYTNDEDNIFENIEDDNMYTMSERDIIYNRNDYENGYYKNREVTNYRIATPELLDIIRASGSNENSSIHTSDENNAIVYANDDNGNINRDNGEDAVYARNEQDFEEPCGKPSEHSIGFERREHSSGQPISYNTSEQSYKPSDHSIGHPSEKNTNDCKPISYNPSEQSIRYKPSEHSIRYKPSEHSIGYKPSEHSIGYKPSEHSTGYKPSEHSIVYKPSEHSIGYKPSEHSIGYKPSEHSIGYKPSEHSIGYKQSEHSVGYKPSEHSISYKPSEHSVDYKPSEHSISYKPSEESVGYKPNVQASYASYTKINEPPIGCKSIENLITKKPSEESIGYKESDQLIDLKSSEHSISYQPKEQASNKSSDQSIDCKFREKSSSHKSNESAKSCKSNSSHVSVYKHSKDSSRYNSSNLANGQGSYTQDSYKYSSQIAPLKSEYRSHTPVISDYKSTNTVSSGYKSANPTSSSYKSATPAFSVHKSAYPSPSGQKRSKPASSAYKCNNPANSKSNIPVINCKSGASTHRYKSSTQIPCYTQMPGYKSIQQAKVWKLKGKVEDYKNNNQQDIGQRGTEENNGKMEHGNHNGGR